MRRDADGVYSFQLVSDSEQTVLSSTQTYNDQDTCVADIRRVIQNLPTAGSYRTVGSRLELNVGNTTLMRSDDLGSANAASKLRDELVEDASDNKEYQVELTTTSVTETESVRGIPAAFEDVDVVTLYDFTQRSSSGQAGFELFRGNDEQYYFHFNDADGRALLYGRRYKTTSPRLKRIRNIIKASSKDDRYEIIEENGQYYFILKARNQQEIARSRRFQNRAEAERYVTYAKENIPTYTSQYISSDKKKRRKKGNQYDLTLASSSGAQGFESLRGQNGDKGYYFHFNDDDGNPLLHSQSYTGGKGRDNGMLAVIRSSGIEDRFEIKESEGQYYFIIRAGNRQEIARSRNFQNRAEAERYIQWLMLTLPGYAQRYGVQLESNEQIVTETESFTLDFVAPPSPTPRSIDEYLECDAYTGAAGFHRFSHEGEHYFGYNSDAGETLLRSEGYTTTKARENGIDSVVKNAPIRERWAVKKTDDGQHYYSLRAGNNQEIARSCLYQDEKAMALALAGLMGSFSSANSDVNTAMAALLPAWGMYSMDWEGNRVESEPAAVPVIVDEPEPEVVLPVTDGADEEVEAFDEADAAIIAAGGVGAANTVDFPEPEEEIPAADIIAGAGAVGAGAVVTNEVIEPVPPVVKPEPVIVNTEKTPPPPPHAGVPVTETRRAGGAWGWLPWLLGLLLLGLLLFFLLRGCDGCGGCGDKPDVPDGNVVTPPPPPPPVTDTVEAEVVADPLGPDAAAMGLASGSLAARMADFLSDPTTEVPSRRMPFYDGNFPYNSAHMDRAAFPDLDAIARVMKQYPDANITIYGYIDETESDEYNGRYADGNITLSGIRARCLYRKLIDRGISGDRMIWEGRGKRDPIAPGKSATDLQRNRRLDVIITRK